MMEDFLTYLLTNRAQSIARRKVYIRPGEMISEEELMSYSNEGRELYWSIFTSEENSAQNMIPLQELNFPEKKTEIPQCNFYKKQKTQFFKCHTCFISDSQNIRNSYVFCKQCFQVEKHLGHRYQAIMCSGALCDCGIQNKNFKGSCKKHNGKIPEIIIDEEQQKRFLLVFKSLFHWIFLLFKNQRENQANKIGFKVAKYLYSLNEESVFYNILTTKLLFDEIKEDSSILRKVFRYLVKKQDLVSNEFNKLFFCMRYSKQFQCKISQQYILAYNTIEGFQQSQFYSIGFQFLIIDNVFLYCLQKKLALRPKKKAYNFKNYCTLIMSLLNIIDKENKVKFLDNLFQQGAIQAPILQEIQSKCVTVQGQSFAIFSRQNFIQDYKYGQMIFKILEAGFYDKIFLTNLIKVYLRELKKDKFYNNKNKLFLPYERTLGLVIFSIFQGNLENIRIDELKNQLSQEFQQKQICQILKVVCQRMSISLKQYAKTFVQGHQIDQNLKYFDCIWWGATNVNIDILVFKICLILLSQSGDSLQCLCEFYEIHDSEFFIKSQMFAIQQNLLFGVSRKNIKIDSLQNQFLKILLECSISVKEQIYVRNLLQIKSQFSEQEQQIFFKGICQNIHKFDSLFFQLAENYLFGKGLKEKQNLITYFNRQINSETYHLNKNQLIKFDNSQMCFPYQKIRSMTKVLNAIGYESHKQNNPENIIKSINKVQTYIGNKIFSENFLKFLTDKKIKDFQLRINKENITIEEKKEIKDGFQNFIIILQDIDFLVFGKENKFLNNFLQEIKEKSLNAEVYEFIKKLFKQEKRNESAMIEQESKNQNQKFQQKKRRRQEQMKERQKLFNTQILEHKEDQVQCIVCKQQTEDGFNNMCYLADLRQTNFIHAINRIKGRFFTFKSCFHCIHLKCFTKLIQDEPFVNCPLCKQVSTIILPIQKQLLSEKPISLYITEKIQDKKKSILTKDQFLSQAQDNIMISLINSIVQRCCFNLYITRKDIKVNDKQKKMMIITFLMVKRLYEGHNSKHKEAYLNQASQYLEQLNTLQVLIKKKPYPIYKLFAFLFQIIWARIQNKKLNKKDFFVQAQNKLSFDQMQFCWNMLRQVTNMQDTSIQEQKSAQKLNNFEKESESKTTNQMLDFFKPPENVNKLIQLRDQTENECKKQHQVAYCVICKYIFCVSCDKAKAHAQEWHLGHCLFFNVFTGEIITYYKCLQQKKVSVYTNKFGVCWTSSKQPNSYQLDNQKYQQILKNYLEGQTKQFF